MGVTTVIKDYGTDILNAIRENDLDRLRGIVEKSLKGNAKIQKLCISDIKHKPTKKFACPLILAARQEDPKIMIWMMEKGTDPNFIHHTIFSSKKKEIVTALHIAVDLGFYDTVQVLLDANADPNIGDHNHETPLHIATKKADKVMVRMLLSKGADPAIPDRKGNAALHIATLYGHLQIVRSLLKYDADVYQKGQWGTIPPHIAAKEGHIHLIHLFCKQDVGNINIKIPCYPDKREKAPIHLAAENGHVETVLTLLDQFEADTNQKDSDGNTPLHCVVLNQYNPHRMRDKEYFNETARVLLKYRTAVNEKNIYGDTALHLAAMNQFQRIVELLLAIGANPFAENDEHLKPIDVVRDFDPVTKQILKNAMLNPKQPLSASLASFRNELDLTPASSQLYIHKPRKYSENGMIDDYRGHPDRHRDIRNMNMSYVSQSTLSQSMDSVFDDYPQKQRPRSASQGRDQGRNRAGNRGRQPEPQTSPSQQRRQQNRQDRQYPDQQQQLQQYQQHKSKQQRLQPQYEDDDDDYDPMYDDVKEPVEPTYAKPEKKPKPKQVSSSAIQTDQNKMRSAGTQHQEDDDNISLTSSIQTVSTVGIPDADTMNAELKRIIAEQRKQLQVYEEQTYSELGSVLDHSVLDSNKPYRPLAFTKERPRPSPRSSTRSTSSMRPIPAERSQTPSSIGSRNSPTFQEQSKANQAQQRNNTQKQPSHYQNSEAIRVNNVPGKPGSIEVSYGGGPISISVDPQSMQYQIQRQQEEQVNRKRTGGNQQYQQQGYDDDEYEPDQRSVDPPNYNQRHQHKVPSDQRQYGGDEGHRTGQGQSPQSSSYTQDYSEDYNGFYDSTEIESQQSYSVHSTDREMVTDAIKHSVFEVMGHRTLESAQDSLNESPRQQGADKPAPKIKPVAQKRSKTPTNEQRNEGLSLPPEPQETQLQPTPPQALHVARADEEASQDDDAEPSPDVTPNASPQYKSFSQKMALFKEVEARSQENTPEKPRKPVQRNLQRDHDDQPKEAPSPRAGTRWGQNKQTTQIQDETHMVATPEASHWKVKSGETAVVEHTDVDLEKYEGSPAALRRTKRVDYTRSGNTDRDSSYMASAQINSSYTEEDSDSDDEAVSKSPALIKASQHPYESHEQYYSISGDVDVNSESSSAAQTPSQTPRTAQAQVTHHVVRTTHTAQQNSVTTTTTTSDNTYQQEHQTVTEPYQVSEQLPKSDSGVQSSTEQREQTAVEQFHEYEEEPGSRRLNIRRHKTVSPVTIQVSPPSEELRSSGAKTPDSIFSQTSSRWSGSLNMRVTGEVPKAYSNRTKGSARTAFMLHKPEGIESCSEGSDVETGSLSRHSRRVNSLDRLSRSSDRLSRYSDSEVQSKDVAPEDEPPEEPPPPPPNPVLKLRGPLPKPYKSFGKIEPKIDALLDALEENEDDAEHRAQLEASLLAYGEEPGQARVGHWVEQAEPTQVSMENLAGEYAPESDGYKPESASIGQQQGMDQGVVGQHSQLTQISSEIRFIDSDSDTSTKRFPSARARQADGSLSEGSFKKNLKMSEPTAESYDTSVATQQVITTSETVTTSIVKASKAPQAEIVELDDLNTSKSSTDFDEDREAQLYGEGPKVIEGSLDIRRPPRPKLIGAQPHKNRHSIESEVDTIPVDPEFIIEEPKKKKPPRPKVVHPVTDSSQGGKLPCPVAQQVSSNFSQQPKSSTKGKNGRITPKSNLAVLDTLDEQSESDMSEYYDQEPSRRVPRDKGKSAERQLTRPELTEESTTETEASKDDYLESYDSEPGARLLGRGKGTVEKSASGQVKDITTEESTTETEASKDDYLESYDSEPGVRKWGRGKGTAVSSGISAIKRPGEGGATTDTTEEPASTETSESLAVEDPHEFENFGRGVQNRSSGIESDAKRRSITDMEINKVDQLESYDSEPGARKWGRGKGTHNLGTEQLPSTDQARRVVERPSDRPPSPPRQGISEVQQQQPETQYRAGMSNLESYDDEPGSRRRRFSREDGDRAPVRSSWDRSTDPAPPEGRSGEQQPMEGVSSVHGLQDPSAYNTGTADQQQQHVDVDVRVEQREEENTSSEDDEVAQISAAADERRAERRAKKQAAILAEKQRMEAEAMSLVEKEEAERNAVAARRLAEEGEQRAREQTARRLAEEGDEIARQTAARRLAEEGGDQARQAAIHEEMMERERLAQAAQEEAMLNMQQYVDEQRSVGAQLPPSGQERIKGRRQAGGPQGRSQQQQLPQQQQYQGQPGYPSQYPPGQDPSRYEQDQYSEQQQPRPSEQKIPTHLLAQPEKKKKGGFFSFGSSKKKKDRPERSSESSAGGRSDSEYKSDGEGKKKKKGLFGRRKDSDSDNPAVIAPQVTIPAGQQQSSYQGQPANTERGIDVGATRGHPHYPQGHPQHSQGQGYLQGHPQQGQGYPQGHPQHGQDQGYPQGHPQHGQHQGYPQGHPQHGQHQGYPQGNPQHGQGQNYQQGHPQYGQDQDYQQGHPEFSQVQDYQQGHPPGNQGQGPLQVNVVTPEVTTPEESPRTPQSAHGILATVMGAPTGSNLERNDTVRESGRKAGFYNRRRPQNPDGGSIGTIPYVEGDSDEEQVQYQQNHQGQTQTDEQVHPKQYVQGQQSQTQVQGQIHVQGQQNEQVHKGRHPETGQSGFQEQHAQQAFQEAAFSSVTASIEDQRRVRADQGIVERHPDVSHRQGQPGYLGQQPLHAGVGRGPVETNIDDDLPSHQRLEQGHQVSADLAAQLFSQKQGPPQVFYDAEGRRIEQSPGDRGQNAPGNNPREQGRYPTADDTETVSKLWKEREEREGEMERLMKSMSDQEAEFGEVDDEAAKLRQQPQQYHVEPMKEGSAKWGKKKHRPNQQQGQIIGQPALGGTGGETQPFDQQRSFQEAAFSSVTSSIEDQRRYGRMEEGSRGRHQQPQDSQHLSNIPGSASPIRRPTAVYGSPAHDPRTDPQKSMADDEATMAAMWGAQHKPDPKWLQQQGVNTANRAQTEVVVMDNDLGQQQEQPSTEPFQRGRWGTSRRSTKPKRPNVSKTSGAVSDSEAFSKRKNAKSISFEDNLNDEDDVNIHSEAEMFDMEGPTNKAEASRTLQQVAMDTISSELNYQPKLKPRRHVWEQTEEDYPVYKRGKYKPTTYMPVSRDTSHEFQGSSSRYNDSEIVGKMWSGSQGQNLTDSEADADTEDMTMDQSMDTSRGNISRGGVSGVPHAGRQQLPGRPDQRPRGPQGQSAFTPISPGGKKVKIVEAKRKKKKKDKAPRITEPGPVDFSQYDAIAKVWMEKVDKKTVQKSKTMKLAVLPEGQAPPARITNKLSYQMTSDDVFLPPQWVIARGRSLRKIKHLASSSSLGNQRLSSSALNDSDYELSDRPFSPGRQMVLFFKVGSNWKDLAWVLFEGVLSDSETIRMIKDIQLKNPGQLTEQVNDLMKRWWARRGQSATIEELYMAMDIINMGYIKEEHFDVRSTSVTAYTDTEDDLDISEIDEADPDVSRLMTEYQARSLNASFECDVPPENRTSVYAAASVPNMAGGMTGPPGFGTVSADNILQRLDQRGLIPPRSGSIGSRGALDSSRNTLDYSRDNLMGRRSPGYGSGRRSPYGSGRRSPGPVHNSSYRYDASQEDYSFDEEGRQRFLIVQPQLQQSDYRHETAI